MDYIIIMDIINQKDMEPISREQFLAAYNKYPPSRWIRFIFRYFSKSTEREDMKVSKIIVWILAISFVIGFIATVINLPRPIIGIATIIYAIVLATVVYSMLSAHLLNNARLRKVRKLLGISREEYDMLASLYFD